MEEHTLRSTECSVADNEKFINQHSLTLDVSFAPKAETRSKATIPSINFCHECVQYMNLFDIEFQQDGAAPSFLLGCKTESRLVCIIRFMHSARSCPRAQEQRDFEVAVLGSLSLMVLMVCVDVKQY